MSFTLGISAQGFKLEKTNQSSSMKWNCPEIKKYQELLFSLKNENFKIYASNVKENFELLSDPASPSEKYLVTQAILNIENPLFNTENLLNHIANWIKTNKVYKSWGEHLNFDMDNKKITSAASIQVATHASYLNNYRVYVSPTLVIQLIENNQLMVLFMADSYKNIEYAGSDNRLSRTFNEKISEVFPFVPKSSHKNTYAKAYVGTYLYFWSFIDDLKDDLNKNFTKDMKMLSKIQYEHSKDSLKAIYGEPTKIIADNMPTPDINRELRFYENAQRVVFMGKTIYFEEIISCEIADDPQYIPGRSTTYGAGLCIFGFGFGGAETYSTPGKTLHNYVVNVKIDNLAIPFIRIGTGSNEYKATDIASSFEYILRHQQDSKSSKTKKTRRK